MKIQFLGTAAAEGWPALFCQCENCMRAKFYGNKNIRTRSQAIINDDLLIDFPADTFHHFLVNDLDMSKVKNIIITHSHDDHYYPADLELAIYPYAHAAQGGKVGRIEVFGNESVLDKKSAYIKDDSIISYNLIKAFEKFELENYIIEPLRADHDKSQNCIIFSITDKKDEKKLLYGNDTGYFTGDTWDYLVKNNSEKFDFVSLDTTCVVLEGRENHMSIQTVCELRDKMLELSLANDKTIFCMNHFSHNGKLIYDELVPVACGSGFIVSYDGMIFKV